MASKRIGRGLVAIQQQIKQKTIQKAPVALSQQRSQHAAIFKEDSAVDYLTSPLPPFRSDFSQDACTARRKWAEHNTGAKLTHMGEWNEKIDTNMFCGNIEMPMGTVKIPVAAVGPLTIHGEHAMGEFIAPFATLEGALTASMQRGMNAVNAGSGAITRTGKQRCSRAPCIVTRTAGEAQMLGNWVKGKRDILQQEVVSKVSSHAILEDIIPVYDFEAVHVGFLFSTGDACGQNVATVCAWSILHWIKDNLGQDVPEVNIKNAWIESNGTSDKKPGSFNLLHGRGISTEAECVMPEEVLNKYLGCTGDEFLSYFYYSLRMTQKTTPGAGFSCNPANTLAALFMATGQDVACVADSINGFDFSVVKHNGEGEGVLAKVSFQNLLVGTVGGGTALPTQSEGLDMLDCRGAGKVRKFAEIATAFSLALDISTASAIVSGKFATGHNRLGRNRPT